MAADTIKEDEDELYGLLFKREIIEMEHELEEIVLDEEWSEDEWKRSYQSDWDYIPYSCSMQEDFRYSATSPFVNTICAAQNFTPKNQYVAKLGNDEETDSTSTHLNDMLKTEDSERQLSEEIEDHQINMNSFQDVEIEIPFQNLRDELFENPNPRYTNLSQNPICFDESFNLYKINLDAKPCYDNNHVYRLDFLENEKEAMNFNFDNFMPNEPKIEINTTYNPCFS